MFEEADGGTLFFDEIAELPADLQPKLLRAIEKREVRPVGGARMRRFSTRLLFATNRSLETEVNSGRFREDLYYRISVVQVTLPPLRERLEDVPPLIDRFLAQFGSPGAEPPSLPLAHRQALEAGRPWPGNVRELRNLVERAMLLSQEGLRTEPPAQGRSDLDLDLTVPFHQAVARAREEFTTRYLESLLRSCDGNVSAASRRAGISRNLIQRYLRRRRG